MADCLHLRIAGVDYVVVAPPGISTRTADAIQDEFAVRAAPGVDSIHVDLIAGGIPHLSAWQVLASHGSGWSIRTNGAQRCLCIGAPAAGRPANVIASWTRDTRCATVYCAPERITAAGDGAWTSNPAGYPVDQMLLIYYLAPRRGLLVHAAGLVVDGSALIFPGVSGAGKSTLTQQFLARGWPTLLSDERIFVRELGGALMAFGTPWPGDAGVAVNAGAPPAAILFPARGEQTRIIELSRQAALDRLLPATSMLWHEPELLSSQLETCERLLRNIPAFELGWSPGAGVVDDVQRFAQTL